LKILIVASSRSGSTTLTRMIGNILNYVQYHEPFNYGHPSYASKIFPKILSNNCVVKSIIDQKPIGGGDILEFYKKYVNKFDKVILLSRKNKQEVYESMLHRVTYFWNGDWHTPYIYEELPENDRVRKWVQHQSNLLESLSEISNIPITWYEDIYSGNKALVELKIKEWKIDSVTYENSKKYLNTENKYRKQPKIL